MKAKELQNHLEQYGLSELDIVEADTELSNMLTEKIFNIFKEHNPSDNEAIISLVSSIMGIQEFVEIFGKDKPNDK